MPGPYTSLTELSLVPDLAAKLTRGTNLWAASQGYSKVGGIRTVIIGESFVQLSGHIDNTNGTALVYNEATGTSYYQGGGYANTTDYGWFTWADALMMAPHYLISNSGVGGTTLAPRPTPDGTSVEERLQDQCIKYNPELVYLSGGRNDFVSGASFDTVRAAMIRVLDRLSAINAFVCIVDVPPSAGLGSTQANTIAANLFNDWLMNEVRRRRNCALVSASSIMANPDVSANGAALANTVLLDGTHNNNLGAYRIGAAIAKVMTPLIRPWNYYPTSPSQGWDYSNTDGQIIRSSNPLMFGTGGTSGTGFSGSIATGYETARVGGGTQTAVGSKVNDADGVGLAQRLAMTFAAADDGFGFGALTSIHPRFVAGKVMEMQCDLAFAAGSAAIINRIEFIMSANINGVAYNGRAMQRVTSSPNQGLADNIQPLDLAGVRMRLRSPRWYFPSGPCTQLQHFIRFYGSGAGVVTVDISKYALRQYTPA